MFEPDRIATEQLWWRWPFAFSISARPDFCNFMVRSYSTQAKVNGDWPRAQAALLRTSQTHDLLLSMSSSVFGNWNNTRGFQAKLKRRNLYPRDENISGRILSVQDIWRFPHGAHLKKFTKPGKTISCLEFAFIVTR